jgi:hypothetical protein
LKEEPSSRNDVPRTPFLSLRDMETQHAVDFGRIVRLRLA